MLFGLAAIGSLCIAANLWSSGVTPSPPAVGSRVRGATPAVNAMLATGARRSSTFARLVKEIDETDLIVYVEIINTLPPGLDGRMMFLISTGGARYLRVQVDANLPKDDLIAVVGHELQHALEVAAHPKVQSSQDLAMLYRLIGMHSPGIDNYDTTEARSIGRRVRAELLD